MSSNLWEYPVPAPVTKLDVRFRALSLSVQWWGSHKPCTSKQVVSVAAEFEKYLREGGGQ